MKKLFTFLSAFIISTVVWAATFYGPISLQTSITISNTSWKTVLTQTVPVTNSVRSCQIVPLFGQLCLWDNTGQITVLVKDVNAVTGLKYRFLVDGNSANASVPILVDNGDGSVSLTSYTHGLQNGNRVFKLQVAKKVSSSPTSVLSPSTGDIVQMGVLMSKP